MTTCRFRARRWGMRRKTSLPTSSPDIGRLHAILLDLDAEAIHGRTMLFERQGSGRR